MFNNGICKPLHEYELEGNAATLNQTTDKLIDFHKHGMIQFISNMLT